MEGRDGEPRAKYIHTVESGLWGKPTVINNVETLSMLPFIVREGGEAFAKIGSAKNGGDLGFAKPDSYVPEVGQAYWTNLGMWRAEVTAAPAASLSAK